MGLYEGLEKRVTDYVRAKVAPISAAKALGKYKGGKSRINVEEIQKLKAQGLGATAISKRMNIHRDSVYRLLKKLIFIKNLR